MPLIADHPYVAFCLAIYIGLSIGFPWGWATRSITMIPCPPDSDEDEVTGIGA